MLLRPSHQLLLLVSVAIFIILPHKPHAQPSTSGFKCSPNESIYPCQTYLYYRATSPNFLELANVSDLFGVTRLMISRVSNISSPSSPLSPSQPLLIPITCQCNTNSSSFNTTYRFVVGDSMYKISTTFYQNLTTYQAVEVANPTLVPTDIDIGTDVIFPLFCKCLNKTGLRRPYNYLITYVFQPSDSLASVARKLGSDVDSITSFNGADSARPFYPLFVPVSKLPSLNSTASPSPTPPPPPPPPPSVSTSTSHRRKGVIIGLIILAGVLGILVILLGGVLFWAWLGLFKEERRRSGGEVISGSEKGGKSTETRRDANEINAITGGWNVNEKFMEDVWECMDKYKLYNIEEVRKATLDFDASCLIQGSVYKGKIGDEMFAIKRMKWNAYEELKILQKVNHGNLVKLDGFCIDPDGGTCYLVYEYVENGSLDSWLHSPNNSKKLNWTTRLQIAIDVASGLQYIHEHATPSVVHKDIKSSNVLLDNKLKAKIANFGLARSGCNAITMHIVGTQGYLAPEYLADGLITTRMDVFAFGVVLLELLSGLDAIDKEGKVLWMSAEKIFDGSKDEKEEKLKRWMDRGLLEQSCSIDSVMNVMAVAVACLQRDPSKRPTMVDVVYMLSHSGEYHLDGRSANYSSG